MKILSKKKQIIARENNSKLYNFFWVIFLQ